jgi:predicted phosphodiesterase
VRELVSVATDGAELFVDGRVLRMDGLAPGRAYEVAGVAFRTHEDLGARRCTFATANDVHFGETVCGLLEGGGNADVFRSEPGATPYPEVMSRAVVADMAARDPAAVVVKGDLTDDGDDGDYDRFLAVWGTPFGERLVHVRGNHDAYRGRVFAAWSHQTRRLDGVTLAVLDTARPGEVGGHLDTEQLEWLDATGADADQPVVVLGHHPVWNPADRAARGLHGISAEDSDRLVEVLTRRPALCAYLAGHTHRNRCRWVDGVALAEVACVKDFPGAWAEYQVHERGIAQVVRRAMAPAAVAWAERTRAMFAGHYAAYAMGTLEDRAFVVPTTPSA